MLPPLLVKNWPNSKSSLAWLFPFSRTSISLMGIDRKSTSVHQNNKDDSDGANTKAVLIQLRTELSEEKDRD